MTTVAVITFVGFGLRAAYLRRDYPGVFTLRSIGLQYALNFSAFALAIAVLRGPEEDKLSNYVAVLVLLLGGATISFTRLLFYRKD